MSGVKVTKTVAGAIQVGQNRRHRRGVFGSTCQHRLSSAAAVHQCGGWVLVPCPRYHPAWASEGTPVGHWGLKAGRLWPVWIRQQIHGKHFYFLLLPSIFTFTPALLLFLFCTFIFRKLFLFFLNCCSLLFLLSIYFCFLNFY